MPETDLSRGFYKGVMQHSAEMKLDKLISKKTVDRLRDTKIARKIKIRTGIRIDKEY